MCYIIRTETSDSSISVTSSVTITREGGGKWEFVALRSLSWSRVVASAVARKDCYSGYLLVVLLILTATLYAVCEGWCEMYQRGSSTP
jgi:hypothetical protein